MDKAKLFNVLVSYIFAVAFLEVHSQASISPDIVIKNADRTFDLTSQLGKVTCRLIVENSGKGSVKNFVFAVEPDFSDKVAFISASTGGSSKNPLKIASTQIKNNPGRFWQIELKDVLSAGKTASVEVEYVLSDALLPYPTVITQREKQLVKFIGSTYMYSPYKVVKQATVFQLVDRNIESFTRVNPTSQSDNTVTYGPYQNAEPFKTEITTIHFENNNPFLRVTRLERVIEVSHWGNIAVEETIDVVHVGAKLKGSFSRYEYQREAGSGVSSVKSFRTVLPAASRDVYYRDDIGNISTSHLRNLPDSVELDLRPRFPLFGGWKTHYTLGYNVPSYEYLYHSGDNYKLKMRLIDHIFDDMIVEEVVTKIILPEGSESITLHSPFDVLRLPDSRHSTYLDTKGRPVISVTAKRLVENHIQDFELDYLFPRILMLQEPLLVVVALFLLFVCVIIYVRLDFSISRDEAGESKMRVAGLVEKVVSRQDARAFTYQQQEEFLARLKTSKDVGTYMSAMKTVTQDYKTYTQHIAELLTKLKPDAPDVAEKVSELQKIDKNLKEVYTQKQSLYVDKLVPGKIGRGQFVEAENSLNKKRDDAVDRINAIMKALH